MELFVEQDSTYDKCVKKIIKKYGDAVTIWRRKDAKMSRLFGLFEKDVVEVTFTINEAAHQNTSVLSDQLPTPPIHKPIGTGAFKPEYEQLNDEQERQKIIRRYANRNPAAANELRQYLNPTGTAHTEGTQAADPDGIFKQSKAAEQDASVRKLAETVERLVAEMKKQNEPHADPEHENIIKLQKLLEDNDFSPSYIKKLSVQLKNELSYTEIENFLTVQKKLFELLADSICIKQVDNQSKTRVILLVGPTGVGKTTTLAKIAVQYIRKNTDPPLRVKVITIDNWRIGAAYQMQRYCELMGIPLMVASNPSEFKKYMALYREEADVICIDTIGRSPKDREKIANMQNYFAELGEDAEIYLTVCAGTRINDIREIMKEYAVFKYTAFIITKFDETSCVGNLFSILAETNVPVTYITAGQEVPQDFTLAAVETFLKKLKGFSVDEEYIDRLCNKDKQQLLKASVI